MTETEQRTAILAEARTWVGTPHIHQACEKGVGVDCAMLIRACGEACGVMKVADADMARFANYSRRPNPRRMTAALGTFLVSIESHQATLADVMYLDWNINRNMPMHVAILAELGPAGRKRPTMIHALARPGRFVDTKQPVGRVVEHGFTAEWPGRVVSWWRYPGLADIAGTA